MERATDHPESQSELFEIYTEAALPDVILDRLSRLELSVLKMTGESADTSCKPITISAISTTLAVYKWVSVYGPDVFDDITGNRQESTVPLASDLRISISRIAPISGDVLIQFSGNEIKVNAALMLFLQKTGKEPPCKASILAARYIALSAPKELSSTQFKCSQYPYGFLPGYLIQITSASIEEVLYFSSEISRASFGLAKASNCKSFAFPIERRCLSVLQPIPSLAVSASPPQPKPPKMCCELLQFTRQEVTHIIGKGGARIENLRKKTRAHITVVPLNHIGDTLGWMPKPQNNALTQFIRITGTKSQVREAMIEIESDIYQYRAGGITIR